MNGLRFVRLSSAAVAVALACVPIVSAQDTEKPADRPTCKIYSLANLGDDPELCRWIADTIPRVIEPESWQEQWGTSTLPPPSNGKKNGLSYYAPANVMVVFHMPAVHAQIDEFLQNLKKAMPAQKTAKHARPASDPQVLQAQFYPPVQQSQGTYPVPMQPKQPKHLFHFIIRYEGEGIIDQNVVRFTKAMTAAAKAEANSGNVVPPPGPSSSYSVLPPAPPAFGSTPPMPPGVLPPPSEEPVPGPPPPLPF